MTSLINLQKILRTSFNGWRITSLSLNVLKTDFIIVGPRSKMRDLEETLCITIQNESIYRAPFVKSLGFFIDENLDSPGRSC